MILATRTAATVRFAKRKMSRNQIGPRPGSCTHTALMEYTFSLRSLNVEKNHIHCQSEVVPSHKGLSFESIGG